MIDALIIPLLVLAIITSALIAGLFYGFACGVMPGLSRVDDRTFVASMVSINSAIQNPLFAFGFFGAILFTIGAFFASLSVDSPSTIPVGIAGLFSLAALVITFARNIPLNVAMARDRASDIATSRSDFESRWVAWNGARAVFSTSAVACLAIALVVQ